MIISLNKILAKKKREKINNWKEKATDIDK